MGYEGGSKKKHLHFIDHLGRLLMCGKNAKKRKECIHLETCQELNDILALFHELYTIITKLTSSNNACIWCKINKPNRWKMDFDLHHYNTASLRRTHQEIKAMANKKGTQDRYSFENIPLLEIDLDHHVILDELHLLLRIMDVLINNIVKEVIQWDMKENLKKKI